MKRKIILLACLGISLVSFRVLSQTKSLEETLFPRKQKSVQKQIPYKSFKVFHAENKVVVAGTIEPEGEGEFSVYDLDGNELWKKGGFKSMPWISLGEKSEKIIAISDYNLGDEQVNACYDKDGNKMWEKWITSPGLTQSPNGDYGITTMVSGEEGKGKFQIFDLSTGMEISHPISLDYSYFYAKFIDDQRIALLLQQVKYQEDINTAERQRACDK